MDSIEAITCASSSYTLHSTLTTQLSTVLHTKTDAHITTCLTFTITLTLTVAIGSLFAAATVIHTARGL